ncbi:major prion protein-like [Sceloporus undulatus]|uniref:major prion protein-like n=1 Tax=Sceloporus undulatus TaxID=8520 RepID=UPI001C4C2214|nr:major prion protein-like [Sceloporus undulatus]
MKGKYLVSCSIAVIMILLLADVIDSKGSSSRSGSSHSKSRSGSSRSRSSSSRTRSRTSGSHSSSTGERSHLTSSKSERSSGRSVQKSTHPVQKAFPSKHHPPVVPQNPGYSSLHPKNGGGSSWDQPNERPWKSKPPQTKLKYVAGAGAAGVAVGAVGGFLVGREMSRMNFHFRYPEEERWWLENRNSYPDRVYFPNYNKQPVPEEVFVRDCVNVTVREFTEPNGNQTTNGTEIKVMTQVVHQMCTEEYRDSFLRQAGGGNFGKKSEMTKTRGAVIPIFEGRPNSGYGMAVALHVSFLMMPFFLISLHYY